MPCELLTERRGDALVLSLSAPQTRNALTPQASAAGVEALQTATDDHSVRCIVLRGEGEHFCAGGDLDALRARRELGDADGRAAQQQAVTQLGAFVAALRSCPKPVIAAVEGAAAGAGASLALACDLIVAADDARFVMSYGRIGLTPDGGASWQLARQLPRALALQALWLAEPMSAAQWQQWGLVNLVVRRGEALAQALGLAARLAAMSPQALAGAKELVDAAHANTLTQQLRAETEPFVDCLFSADGAEGLRAFFAKRQPRFE